MHTGVSSVSQQVTIPLGTATLSFWLARGNVDPAAPQPTFQAQIDGTPVFGPTAFASSGTYTQFSANVSTFANGGAHTLSLIADAGASTDEFLLDDVSINATPAPDADADGVPDASDNCPAVSNQGQANNDGDSEGDPCDADDDNDGVTDAADSCPVVAGSLAAGGCADGDGDGVRDDADPCPGAAGAGSPDGCPNLERKLTLKYKKGAFRGVLSPAGRCDEDQKVTILEKKKGKDPKLGNDETSDAGKYVVGAPREDGKFYAEAPAAESPGSGHCLEARSKRLKLD